MRSYLDLAANDEVEVAAFIVFLENQLALLVVPELEQRKKAGEIVFPELEYA